MEMTELLSDLTGRIDGEIRAVADGLTETQARYQPDPEANHICWLLWHVGRCIDAQLHGGSGFPGLVEAPQLWAEWKPRLALPLPDSRLGEAELGYAQDPADAAAVIAPVAELEAYAVACCAALSDRIDELVAGDLDRIINDSWDPPVSAGVRLVSILDDCIQHLGAAAYLKGVAVRLEENAG